VVTAHCRSQHGPRWLGSARRCQSKSICADACSSTCSATTSLQRRRRDDERRPAFLSSASVPCQIRSGGLGRTGWRCQRPGLVRPYWCDNGTVEEAWQAGVRMLDARRRCPTCCTTARSCRRTASCGLKASASRASLSPVRFRAPVVSCMLTVCRLCTLFAHYCVVSQDVADHVQLIATQEPEWMR
jgi:hypothetical protein